MQRNATFDAAKGIGILAVIIAHIVYNKFNIFLYSFHLPLFFIIAGYFYKNEQTFIIFFKKKCKSYLFPYIGCMSIIGKRRVIRRVSQKENPLK